MSVNANGGPAPVSSLSGMTGFARASGALHGVSWNIEVRSVNGKGLDIRTRLPSEYASLDHAMREAFKRTFNRGNIQISISSQSVGAAASWTINEALFNQLSEFAAARGETVKPSDIMSIDGVVCEQAAQISEDAEKELSAAILTSANEAAEKLKAARLQEGAALQPIFSKNIDDIEAEIEAADAIAAMQPAVLMERLQDRLTSLGLDSVSEDRLAQEAALLAQKADVQEELDRLRAHCKQARKLISGPSPVGRKLDFLAQEFNRETNTLCSKSSTIELTRVGLNLKTLIEQFREQAANVE